MSHLDEGQIHALLDGELTPKERSDAETHLASCPECQLLLAEAKGFFAEADRLVSTMVPPTARAAGAVAPPGRVPPGYRWLAWAATVVVAVGLGYYGSGLRRSATSSDTTMDAAGDSPLVEAEKSATEEKNSAPTATSTRQAPSADLAQKERDAEAPKPAHESRREGVSETGKAAASSARAPAAAAGSIAGQRKDVSLDKIVVRGSQRDAESLPAGRLAEEPLPKPIRLGNEIALGFRTSTLEDAVRVLGGSVQLIDGLAPERVLIGPGSALPGGLGDREIVRVVYQDPPGRELWLDQQRVETGDDRAAGLASKVSVLPGDTLVVSTSQGTSRLNWVSQGMFRLGLTGYLPTDSLRSLARRVR